jgi:hypothetical protein
LGLGGNVAARFLNWYADVSVTNQRRIRTLGVWGNWTTISDEDITINSISNNQPATLGVALIPNPYKVDIPFGFFPNTSSKSYNMLNISYEIPLAQTSHSNL